MSKYADFSVKDGERIARAVLRVERQGARKKAVYMPPRVASGGSGDAGRWFRITAATKDGTNYRWTFTAKIQEKTGAGWSGWTDSATDTANYTLYNGTEVPNGSTGTFGNGVSSTNLVGLYAVVPLGVGARVKAWPVTYVDGEGNTQTEWWFSLVNQIDGACQ